VGGLTPCLMFKQLQLCMTQPVLHPVWAIASNVVLLARNFIAGLCTQVVKLRLVNYRT